MAPKPADRRKQKEAKQKKLLLLLIPVFAILMFLQGPALLKVVRGDTGKKEATAAETAPASTDPAATTPAEASADPADPAAGPVDPAALLAPAVLVDSDLPPRADEGQLISFGRFVGKDPFRQLVQAEPGSDGAVADGSDAAGDDAQPVDGGDADQDPDQGDQEAETPNAAKLTVNGVAETVVVGASFPAADPVFRLAAVDGKLAKIGLVTGSFSTGTPTLDLEVGETLTLVSQPDGIRYKIKLLGFAAETVEAPSS